MLVFGSSLAVTLDAPAQEVEALVDMHDAGLVRCQPHRRLLSRVTVRALPPAGISSPKVINELRARSVSGWGGRLINSHAIDPGKPRRPETPHQARL